MNSESQTCRLDMWWPRNVSVLAQRYLTELDKSAFECGTLLLQPYLRDASHDVDPLVRISIPIQELLVY